MRGKNRKENVLSMPDYNVYKMTAKDVMVGYLCGGIIIFIIVYIFLGILSVAAVMGALGGIICVKAYKIRIIAKRKNTLIRDFKILMESLEASYLANINTKYAFESALRDLENAADKETDMIRELKYINYNMQNNGNIGVLLADFGMRSHDENISSFADVFAAAEKSGANIANIVSYTRNIICEKIDIEESVKADMKSGENELLIMIVMAIVIAGFARTGIISGMAGSGANIISSFAAILLISAAYIWGKRILSSVEKFL